MECNVCFDKLDSNKVVKPGCCCVNLCRDCVNEFHKCPRCMEPFPWTPRMAKIVRHISNLYDTYARLRYCVVSVRDTLNFVGFDLGTKLSLDLAVGEYFERYMEDLTGAEKAFGKLYNSLEHWSPAKALKD